MTTPQPPAEPDLGPIAALEDSLLQVAVLHCATSLGLFTAVERTDGRPESVARARGVSTRGVRVTLDALCAMDFVRKSDGRYRLTDLARHYLVEDSPGYYGDTLLKTTLMPSLIDELSSSVTRGFADPRLSERENAGALWAEDFAPSLVSWSQEAAVARETWRAAGVDLHGLRDARVLDLGCGAAVKSLVTAQVHPGNRVTAVDLHPEVLDVARKVADLMGVGDRLDARTGDLRELDLGTEVADLAFSSAVLYFYAPEELAGVFRRIRRALRPGGTLVLNHRMPDDERTTLLEPLLLAVQLFLLHHDSQVLTFAEYRDLLLDAGFERVEQRRWDLLTAQVR
ncbi:class I SAM-dependent methyltransferase [Kitasatospora sp. NPDC097643]|uniref:class I SAM-dependent methyltransferase n=1 Tax=Kitasatospora sp. NPDC097643 TaxID=3157230 RepID=UPI003322DF09